MAALAATTTMPNRLDASSFSKKAPLPKQTLLQKFNPKNLLAYRSPSIYPELFLCEDQIGPLFDNGKTVQQHVNAWANCLNVPADNELIKMLQWWEKNRSVNDAIFQNCLIMGGSRESCSISSPEPRSRRSY
jgi:hypothetical protein